MLVKSAFKLFKSTTFALVGTAGSWIAYSAFGIDHKMDLPPAIDADRREFYGDHSCQLSYYVDDSGSGYPLVLIHSINAAGSSYEMRPIFEHYRGTRPVYALDLPGFGFSERSSREYSPQLYQAAIQDFLNQIVGQPADVIALSLGSEFAAWAALSHPESINTLTMISPSGFSPRRKRRASQSATDSGSADSLHRFFSFPLWGQALYDLIATETSIRFFLKQSFEGEPDQGMLDYDYLTSHQPGAHHAPLNFISGRLFTKDIFERVYQKLDIPVMVLYDKDNFVSFENLPTIVQQQNNWSAERIVPTCGLPQFEQMPAVARALDNFWQANS